MPTRVSTLPPVNQRPAPTVREAAAATPLSARCGVGCVDRRTRIERSAGRGARLASDVAAGFDGDETSGAGTGRPHVERPVGRTGDRRRRITRRFGRRARFRRSRDVECCTHGSGGTRNAGSVLAELLAQPPVRWSAQSRGCRAPHLDAREPRVASMRSLEAAATTPRRVACARRPHDRFGGDGRTLHGVAPKGGCASVVAEGRDCDRPISTPTPAPAVRGTPPRNARPACRPEPARRR